MVMPISHLDRDAGRNLWLAQSAFRDGAAARLLFHGTDVTDPFNVFTQWGEASIGFHFGVAEVANARLIDISGEADDPNACIIIPVICRAARPLRLRDHFTWSISSVAYELADLGVLTDEEADFVIDSADDALLLAAIERAGYDCVVYLNQSEHKDQPTDSVMIWRAELLKSPYAATFDPQDPRLLPQAPTSQADLDAHARLAGRLAAARLELDAMAQPATRLG